LDGDENMLPHKPENSSYYYNKDKQVFRTIIFSFANTKKYVIMHIYSEGSSDKQYELSLKFSSKTSSFIGQLEEEKFLLRTKNGNGIRVDNFGRKFSKQTPF